MNELLDAINARVKAPYFGYALLAFIALNWRGVFLLATTIGPPKVRLEAFDSETSALSLIALPLLAGAIVAATAPWIRYAFAVLSRRPLGFIDNLQLDSEHRKTIRKTELERSRADLFASKESELIERAKRDEVVMSIDDEVVKARLQAELEALRKDRDRMSRDVFDRPSLESLSPVEREMLVFTAELGDGVILKHDYLNSRGFQIGPEALGIGSRREFVRYSSALDSLVSKDLVENVGGRGERFELTSTGWDVAESLAATDRRV